MAGGFHAPSQYIPLFNFLSHAYLFNMQCISTLYSLEIEQCVELFYD